MKQNKLIRKYWGVVFEFFEKLGDNKMNVRKVDNYSSDEVIVIGTDCGNYFIDKNSRSKTFNEVLKKDDKTNKVIKVKGSELQDVIDEYNHYSISNKSSKFNKERELSKNVSDLINSIKLKWF